MFHKRSKQTNITFHFTRELVESKEITISYLQTNSMLVDIFTKSLAIKVFFLLQLISIEGMLENDRNALYSLLPDYG
jgi:hypothetical protein